MEGEEWIGGWGQRGQLGEEEEEEEEEEEGVCVAGDGRYASLAELTSLNNQPTGPPQSILIA